MSKFNTSSGHVARFGTIETESSPSTRTFEGAPGYLRDVKSELFLLGVTNMVSENTFYESAADRDNRYRNLIHKATLTDPDWTFRYLRWLRHEVGMRSASLVGAAEFIRARQQGLVNATDGLSRRVVRSVLARGDEPAEMLAYWFSHYGKTMPSALKRGIGDAVLRLGTEMNYLKWDSEGHGFSQADVLNIVHPGDKKGSRQSTRGMWQKELFGYITDKQYRDVEIPNELSMLTRRQALLTMPVDERRQAMDATTLHEAGMTWESLAGWLQGPMDRSAWEAIIPNMGYMALLRNLRNFDEAGISEEVANQVIATLSAKDNVVRSKQMPLRFLSAYRNASLRWAYSIERALNTSLQNVPRLSGQSLVMIDSSGSMNNSLSARSDLLREDAAVLFGLTLARVSDEARVLSFSNETIEFRMTRSRSLLQEHNEWFERGYFQRMGTNTGFAVRAGLNNETEKLDRLIIVTDEQATGHMIDSLIPDDLPTYIFNVSGYRVGQMKTGDNRYVFGGLTDKGLSVIPLLEESRGGQWPF